MDLGGVGRAGLWYYGSISKSTPTKGDIMTTQTAFFTDVTIRSGLARTQAECTRRYLKWARMAGLTVERVTARAYGTLRNRPSETYAYLISAEYGNGLGIRAVAMYYPVARELEVYPTPLDRTHEAWPMLRNFSTLIGGMAVMSLDFRTKYGYLPNAMRLETLTHMTDEVVKWATVNVTPSRSFAREVDEDFAPEMFNAA